jgi:hypothetical protein
MLHHVVLLASLAESQKGIDLGYSRPILIHEGWDSTRLLDRCIARAENFTVANHLIFGLGSVNKMAPRVLVVSRLRLWLLVPINIASGRTLVSPFIASIAQWRTYY